MIVGSFVVKNEADRYLEWSLRAASQVFDELFVFDDGSTDTTVDIAWEHTQNVFLNDGVSFMEHEGKFRQRAWEMCIDALGLVESDYIFVVDADEILGLTNVYDDMPVDYNTIVHDVRAEIEDMIAHEEDSYNIHIPEIQAQKNGSYYVRTDGYWDLNYAPRLAKAVKKPFYNKKMGSKSIPEEYCVKAITIGSPLKLAHVGYLNPADLQSKYARYSGLKNHGHNDKHIESIIKTPKLQKWNGVTL